MTQQFCEKVVATSESIEAAILLQAGKNPVWHTRSFKAVDDVLLVANNLIMQSHEMNLFFNTGDASMLFETAFGALYIVTIDSETLVVICLSGSFSIHLVNLSVHRLYNEREL